MAPISWRPFLPLGSLAAHVCVQCSPIVWSGFSPSPLCSSYLIKEPPEYFKMQLTLALLDVEVACFGFNGPEKFSALADKPQEPHCLI